jgi:hypothetical protein
MILNRAVFATIYLNLVQPNRYDIENSKDRDQARSIFARRTKYDIALLKQAMQIYNEMLAKETEELFAEWAAK